MSDMKLDAIKDRLIRILAALPTLRKSGGAVAELVEVNVFPLKNVVLFPGGMLPLHIFEDRYKAMTEESISKQIPVAMSGVPSIEMVRPGAICGGGQVTVLEEFPDKRKNIVVEADSRFRIRQVLQAKPFCKVLAEKIADVPFVDAAQESTAKAALATSVRRWIFTNPSLDDAMLGFVDLFEKPQHLADFVGNQFLPTMALKQRLLEESDCAVRVRSVMAFLDEESRKYAKLAESDQSLANRVPKDSLN